MQISVVIRVAVVAWLSACAPSSKEDSPRRQHEKPSAPVEARMRAVAVADGTWDVTLEATPSRDVAWIELRIRGGAESGARFPATRAGVTRSRVERVRLERAGVDLVGEARVPVGNGWRSRAVVVRVAEPRPAPPPPRVVTLPGGIGVAR